MRATLYMVIPCYNDAEVLPVSAPVFLQKLLTLIDRGTIRKNSRILFVNDGSSDTTWQTIETLHHTDAHMIGIDLAYNTGEQNALLAGMFTAAAQADCVITMDSDLQDDINAVDEMLEKFYAGNEIVCGVRSSRKQDSFLERFSSALFYKLMHALNTGLIPEHSNYRLMSQNAIGILKKYIETPFFLPCQVSALGLKNAVVYHERFARAAGSSGYNFKKRLMLAGDAILSHAPATLNAMTCISIICAVLTVINGIAWSAVSIKTAAFPFGLCLLTAFFLIIALLCLTLRLLGGYRYNKLSKAAQLPRYRIAAHTNDG
ncbi:MAG: glycosyltransferase family 2 protein [Clostridia bacterium]|nr:glycosyltransferase family 2 protein [Clostridia bacterium]